ncbi:MAG: hypothetical protein IKD41_01465, partial [Alistipes sp.]|nr:hypothetical protein [Alistipes sp.]
MANDIQLAKAANNIRILAASMVEKAKSGHPGGAMGGADFVNSRGIPTRTRCRLPTPTR